MKKQTKQLTAYLLAGLFTVFNVGLPIALFVCPMMSGDAGTCDCHPAQCAGLAISYPQGDCCNHSVLAERNTTPFLSASKYQAPASEIVLVLSAAATTSTNTLLLSQHLLSNSDAGPPVSSPPIYLLSSALII
jgi:hypothetical protein